MADNTFDLDMQRRIQVGACLTAILLQGCLHPNIPQTPEDFDAKPGVDRVSLDIQQDYSVLFAHIRSQIDKCLVKTRYMYAPMPIRLGETYQRVTAEPANGRAETVLLYRGDQPHAILRATFITLGAAKTQVNVAYLPGKGTEDTVGLVKHWIQTQSVDCRIKG